MSLSLSKEADTQAAKETASLGVMSHQSLFKPQVASLKPDNYVEKSH